MQCDLENLTDATIKPGICLMNCRGEGRERNKLLTENNGCRHEENCMKGQEDIVFSKSRMVIMVPGTIPSASDIVTHVPLKNPFNLSTIIIPVL